MKNVVVILLVGLLLWSALRLGEPSLMIWMLPIACFAAVILYLKRRKEREQDEKLEALTRRVEEQQVEIERLKTLVARLTTSIHRETGTETHAVAETP